MTSKTNEELLEIISSQKKNDEAFLQLIYNLRPMMMKIGRRYLSNVPLYDRDDYIQEGSIVLWSLIRDQKIEGGKFSNLFYTAFEHRCIRLYRDYVLKNWIQIAERKDDFYCYGYHVSTLVVDKYAVEYRKKQKEYNKRWYDKNRRKVPEEEKAPLLTLEERKERHRQQSRAYWEKHKEHYRELRKKWYQEHREYALLYQKAYNSGVRVGEHGTPRKPKR